MKKLLFLLFPLFFVSCTCVFSQIPPQVIYAGADCSTPLPDYRLRVVASDNCEISQVLQTPAPGFVINASNKTVTVQIRAEDASKNFKSVSFQVLLVDTVKPVFAIDPNMAAWEASPEVRELYNIADRIIAKSMDDLDKAIADSSLSWSPMYPGLSKVWRDSSYYKDMMITWTGKGHAVTGEGHRWFTFVTDADSIIYIKKRTR